MNETSAGPVTLITGGGSGIGADTARQLLERGHRVLITGRRAERLRKLAAELGHPERLRAIPGDAADHFWDGEGGLPDRPMLTAAQVAAAIVWAIGQPAGVDVNKLTVRPTGAPIA